MSMQKLWLGHGHEEGAKDFTQKVLRLSGQAFILPVYVSA